MNYRKHSMMVVAAAVLIAGAASSGLAQQGEMSFFSQSALEGAQAVNARDRIGRGPRQNAKGVVIAKDLDDLHDDPNINKETALDERGRPVKGAATRPTSTIS